ncbi:MAG: SprT family zinc-dependent metalloprotease [Deltaproteobacteria bacterium]
MHMLNQIVVSDITVNVVRKRIKNIHLGVYPPDGRVRVSAPLRLSDKAVRLFVTEKLAWIKRHQSNFAGQERQSQREYVTGENHYFLGDSYRLNVITHRGPSNIIISDRTTMEMYVRENKDADYRKRLLSGWYRYQLKELIPALLEKWEPIIGTKVADWGVKEMKTRWGSCNIKAHRIWINLELAMKPLHYLEYIIVHEMTHLLEKHHNERFKGLLD